MAETTIALIGNPNSGKTTFFNGLTGGNVKTGNWPGVTVEKREGTLKSGDTKVKIVDLPGIYSFSAYSEDEKVARDYALSGEATLILNIVDATNLERNLYLTSQLIEMKVPMLVVVNMLDIANKRGIEVDLKALSAKLGFPVIGTSAINSKEVEAAVTEILNYSKKPAIPKSHVEYPNEIEAVIASWSSKVTKTARKLTIDSRWIAIKLLENDIWITNEVIKSGELTSSEIEAEQNKIEAVLTDTADIICADYRYGFIHGVVQSVVKRNSSRQTMTDKTDKIVLNKFLGIPIFLGVMYLLFWATINIGGAFIDFFDIFFGTIFVDGLGALLGSIGTPEWIITVVANGLGGGIQTVATFIPVIFMMFFMLSLLEDSGYMARAAFVMDRFMRLLGLPGKAFVPLLVGFGCTVPAIMGARTLESKKDRYMTIFMSPFMSCGARLPVYAIFAAAFFPSNGSNIVFALYIIGVVFAIFTGLLLKKTLFQGEASYFIMELPPYHAPRLKHILLHTWDRLKGFILRAGKVILIVVAVLSVLNSLGTDGSFGNDDSEDSILSAIGKTITPVFIPMGVEEENWPAVVGLFTGIFAKEAIVGTLSSLYAQIDSSEGDEEEEEEEFSFMESMEEAFMSIVDGLGGLFESILDPLGLGLLGEDDTEALAEETGADESIFEQLRTFFPKGPAQAFAYLLFVLLYFPCVAAFGAVIKETGVLFGILNAVYLTVLGWCIATLFYQITLGHSIGYIILSLTLLCFMAFVFYLLRNKFNEVKE